MKAARLNTNWLLVIRRAFTMVIPIVMIGSVALMLNNFPIPIVHTFIHGFANGVISKLLVSIYQLTQGMIALYTLIAISYCYSETFMITNVVYRFGAMLCSVMCFCMAAESSYENITLNTFSSVGIFTAILTALITSRVFYSIIQLVDRKARRHHLEDYSGEFYYAIYTLVPFLILLFIFISINVLLRVVLGIDTVNELISVILRALVGGIDSAFLKGMVYTIILHILWCFGIHGGNILDRMGTDVLLSESGIVTKEFLDVFVTMGGAGASISLLIAILLVSKNIRNRRLAMVSVPLVSFNINETLMFGFPIILNPMMSIPFIIVPTINYVISYIVVMVGAVSDCTISTVSWTIPALSSGYLATGEQGAIWLQLICIAIGTLVYIPFILHYERRLVYGNEKLIDALESYVEDHAGRATALLSRTDQQGQLAQQLEILLEHDILIEEIPMYYQPIVDQNNQVVAAESLLRWHALGGIISPPLVVAIAEEAGRFDDLTRCIVHRVCKDLLYIKEKWGTFITITINVSARQLNNMSYMNELASIIKSYELLGHINFELTEDLALKNFPFIIQVIEALKEKEILCMIDDFSMGQTSIEYLKTNSFASVKLDRAIVTNVAENERNKEIVESIIDLTRRLNMVTIAEFVETEEIRDTLFELGCHRYQGYYYSPALPIEKFVEFMVK